MKLYRASVCDTPLSPFAGGALRADDDAGLAVVDGVIVDRGAFASVRARWPVAEVEDLRDGLLIPGLIDTHVHYPQVRVIGDLGRPLLEWLEHCALPEEAKLVDLAYAQQIAREFVAGLVSSGTTTALAFGSHFANATDALFAEAARAGVRLTTGLVTSDRELPTALLTTPERARAEAEELIARWHGVGRNRYAVTPRFALSASTELLASEGELFSSHPDLWFTSHLNENQTEVEIVARQFPEARDYLDAYDRAGLVGERSVLAHNVLPSDAELVRLGAAGAAVAHCPTSNSSLGSGVFPLTRHVQHGVRVALGSDVGAGTGFSLLKEGAQAYFMQRLAPRGGYALTGAHLLYLATRAGAEALGLAGAAASSSARVGELSTGCQFDAVWVRPSPASPLGIGLRHAPDADAAIAKLFAWGTPADLARVWIGGDPVWERDAVPTE
ncbi:guanine deaminase [Leucobacter salsicius]|uniref:guanine deaminase n=1 Tax=Leucobacter salsicius TaxID=664638 RepID=UPI000344C016|nr:guanine deaminase [Leucobacter salsicius]